MRGADKGYVNEAAPLYTEFVMRQGLAKLGYTDSLEEIDSFTAECFGVIAAEIAKLQTEKLERSSKKRGK